MDDLSETPIEWRWLSEKSFKTFYVCVGEKNGLQAFERWKKCPFSTRRRIIYNLSFPEPRYIVTANIDDQTYFIRRTWGGFPFDSIPIGNVSSVYVQLLYKFKTFSWARFPIQTVVCHTFIYVISVSHIPLVWLCDWTPPACVEYR